MCHFHSNRESLLFFVNYSFASLKMDTENKTRRCTEAVKMPNIPNTDLLNDKYHLSVFLYFF